MSQISYSIKIVETLQQRESHIRGLAKALHTNQTTIARKVAELYGQNVLDSRVEGKNKVVFLKRTLEAQQYAYLVEIYKLFEAVKKYPQLRRIIEEVRKNKEIKLAILFGSYAKGLANKESDIDIYLETTNRKLKKEVEFIDSRINVKMGEYDPQSLLIKEMIKGHIIIKGVEIYYEKTKLFG